MSENLKDVLETIKESILKDDESVDSFLIDKELWKELLNYITNLQEENEELKEQKKNAIEWIKEHIETYQKNEIVILDWDTFSDPKNLLKILGGDE